MLSSLKYDPSQKSSREKVTTSYPTKCCATTKRQFCDVVLLWYFVCFSVKRAKNLSGQRICNIPLCCYFPFCTLWSCCKFLLQTLCTNPVFQPFLKGFSFVKIQFLAKNDFCIKKTFKWQCFHPNCNILLQYKRRCFAIKKPTK